MRKKFSGWCLLMGVLAGFATAATPNAPEGQTLPASPETVLIADEGKAQLPIVISPESSEAIKKTAADLAGFLKRITGAEFVVEVSKEPKGITLGTLAQFPDEALQKPLAIRDVYDGKEAFSIRSGKGGIRLIANTDLGVSHAAYRFLDLLGCRWFYMGAEWEVIPETKKLTFDLNEDSRPDVWSRLIWFSRLMIKGPEGGGDADMPSLYKKWAAANKMGESLDVEIFHQWHKFPKFYKEEFDAHPEYLALVNGKRQGPQLCVTNKGLQDFAIRFANEHFAKHPEADMVSLDAADLPQWCTCPECAKLGHQSNHPFYLANIVGKALQKTHPGKYVGVLAYNWYTQPPTFALEPNVYVMMTMGLNFSRFSFDEMYDQWVKRQPGTRMGMYEYFSYWRVDNKGMYPGGEAADIDNMQPRIKKYVGNHLTSFSAESTNTWGAHGLGFYIANRLLWDVDANVANLKKDFFAKAFGPAASVMENYFERVNASNKPLPGAALLLQCLKDLEEATTLASARPDVLARLTQLKEYLIYNHLGIKFENASKEEQKARALDWFTWTYRIRNSPMVSWVTYRDEMGDFAEKELKEPNWAWRKTNDNPWKNDQPVTAAELEGLLQKMKTELGGIRDVAETKYSDDFVMVDLGKGKEAQRNQIFFGTTSYLLASQGGEPLTFTLAQLEDPKEKPDLRYVLRDSAGKEITRGKMTVGREPLSLKVPHKGIYWLTCESDWTKLEVEFPPSLPNALLFGRGERHRPSAAMTPAYFYVPKGASEIAFHAYKTGGPVVIQDPSGKVVYDQTSDGRYVSLPVKKGDDGKMWSIGGPEETRLRYLWFFNIPTILSSNPQWGFLPREVAEKDRLKVALP